MELAENDDIEAFLLESYENLDRIERDIIDLEKASSQGEALVRIYRSLHTLKGNCGFLPFPKLESLAHAGESLLSALRDRLKHSPSGERKLAVTPQIVSILLQTVDSIRQILSQIKTTKHEGNNDYSSLIKALTQLQETEQADTVSALPHSAVKTPILQQSKFVESSDSELPEVSALTASESSHIRVSVSLLDRVMNLVGELVLVRNQVLGFSDQFQDSAFDATCQRLNLITAQLQEGVMKTRLQPMSTIWQKFPRVIRDLALASGKQVQVEMEGADTELDKSIVEAIKDPLTHVVRNCIDHGIELPAERTACGKSTIGHIFLRAFYESGKVNIEIGDDGRGLDPERLKVRAQQLGLMNAIQAASASESEAINLIFLPGFSTSDRVTNLSGRGVGMDIVKSNIEKINGSIEIYSQPGQGTTFKLKIPLTLTIIPALIVTCGGDRYAIPQTSLQELVCLEAEQVLNSIEMLYDVPVYRLRGDLVPLVYLNQVLHIKDKVTHLETLSLVIVQAENCRFGLFVDTIEDILEIVVKPLGKQLQALSLFAGATILGDGKVALIVDVVGLANRAGIITKQKHLLSGDTVAENQDLVNRQQILLFQGPQGTRMGIPLTIAFRLEEIPRSAVEKVGNHYVVQSYNRILPLIDLHTIFGDGEGAFASEADSLALVIVSPYSELSVGLVVDRILDIVDESLTIKGIPSRPGVLLSAVIQGQITEILDIETVIRMSNPYLLQTTNRG
ncbi:MULTISPECIES: chemotaxis protein CheW [Nostocales]|uniref:histidine kinase n=3 Tax=Nostocales TaxID=1161 RepID=A0A0C1NEP2_9CYAN|nr:chemotaxis protein CheW [Tolypothrix bouteillei]KAF3887327.1 chemotaxis protein CheA [Tolypothrix bouteillei VB521301]